MPPRMFGSRLKKDVLRESMSLIGTTNMALITVDSHNSMYIFSTR